MAQLTTPLKFVVLFQTEHDWTPKGAGNVARAVGILQNPTITVLLDQHLWAPGGIEGIGAQAVAYAQTLRVPLRP